MPSIILISLAGLISFMALDYAWLAHVAKNFYLDKLSTHVTITDGSLVPYLPAVPLIYITAILAIWVFVFPKVTTISEAFLYGALLGFILYAFYDLTNLATLKEYSWSITIIDTLWGTFALGAVTTIMSYVKTLLA